LHPRTAISNDWPEEFAYPFAEPPGGSIDVQLTPGEYEPAAFTIHALEQLPEVQVRISDPTGSSGTVPSGDIDARLVKYWYQSARDTIYTRGKRVMLPELLVHDDELVKVDREERKNLLRLDQGGQAFYLDITTPSGLLPASAHFEDAAELKPFRMAAGENRHIWLTVHARPELPAGRYVGSVTIDVEGIPCGELRLGIEVLPFRLPGPLLEYAIYYRGTLSDARPGVGDGPKTREQYSLELENMLRHGIQYPTVYDGGATYREALRIRRHIGFPTDKALLLGTGTGTPRTATAIRDLENRVRHQVAELRKLNYRRVYFYGREELRKEQWLEERPVWAAVHRGGGRIISAVYKDAVDYVGDLLDLANISQKPNPPLAERWHALGQEVYNYGNPQSGMEEPATFRRNYGFQLLCAGYDGAMPYAYQHGFGANIWNDFDHATFRDHVFAYPTSRGVVDTMAWEGFREAVDDVRYAAALQELGDMSQEKRRKRLCEGYEPRMEASALRAEIIREMEAVQRRKSSTGG
jgi:hypothetical protein